MIIKSISRKGADASRRVIRYIFRQEKMTPKRYERMLTYLEYALLNNKRVSVAGIRLSRNDIRHLITERADARLIAEMKTFGGTMREFIEEKLLGNIEQQFLTFKHNLRGRTLEENIQEFRVNEENRMRKTANSVSVYHVVLSWGSEDTGKISDRMLKDMVGKFMELRGSGNLYISGIHRETDSLHAHICMSATGLDGKASRLSKSEFQQLKVEMERYQREKYPELVNSKVRHSGMDEKEKGREGYIAKRRDERATIKNALQGSLDAIMKTASSTNDFIGKLEKAGYSVYYRSERLTGAVAKNGLKFRFSKLNCDLEYLSFLDDRLKKEEREKTSERKGITIQKEKEPVDMEVAMQYTDLADLSETKDKAARLQEIYNMRQSFEAAQGMTADVPVGNSMDASSVRGGMERSVLQKDEPEERGKEGTSREQDIPPESADTMDRDNDDKDTVTEQDKDDEQRERDTTDEMERDDDDER